MGAGGGEGQGDAVAPVRCRARAVARAKWYAPGRAWLSSLATYQLWTSKLYLNDFPGASRELEAP